MAKQATPVPETSPQVARDSATATRQRRRSVWMRAALLIFLAFAVTGAVPAALAGQLLGVWRVGGSGRILTSTASGAPDLALPRQAWTATSVRVLTQPGTGQLQATLEPGFPVTLIAHRQSGNTSWAHISWAGPTPKTGGDGWVADAALLAYGFGSHPIGDLGALSPSLAQSIAAYGSSFAAAVYFPDAGQLYRNQADSSFAVGSGFRAMLLAATFASAEAHHTAPLASRAAQIAAADPTASAKAYQDAGGASGVSAYLRGIGITGSQPAEGDWLAGQATVSDLLQFYAAVAAGDTLTPGDRDAMLALLAQSGVTSRLLGGQPVANGSVLVIGSAVESHGWAITACGIVTPTRGARYVLAALIRTQPSQADGEQVLAAFASQLNGLAAIS